MRKLYDVTYVGWSAILSGVIDLIGFVFLLLFFAPVYVPLDLLRGWIHACARVNPVTYFLEAGRGEGIAPIGLGADVTLRSSRAIGTGVVDYVLTIENMAETLMRYVRHWYVNHAMAPAVKEDEKPDYIPAIIGILRARAKYEFSGYRKGTIARRIQRRMGLNHIQSAKEYVEFLRENADEVAALYKDLLITVTSFFRQPEAWQALEELVIAPMARAHPDEQPMRAWVAGCATGEEAYSLAMLLIEHRQRAGKPWEVQVFASDIDTESLAFARADGNTLVIVTADHAHASQIVSADAKAPGLTQKLTTKDGAPMTLSYGNSEEESQGHTGTQLRVAAYGPHAANVVGLTDQTDLFFTMRDAMGIK